MSTLTQDERSDLPELHQRVLEVLKFNLMTQRLAIGVEDDNGVVILTGKVTSFYAKQMAQECIRPLLRATNPHPVLRNLIEVLKG